MPRLRLSLLALFFSIAALAQPSPSQLGATFTFPIGSSDLDDAMRARLDELAAALKQAPGSAQLEIDGYTDGSGGEELNASVSADRAERIAQALVRRGVPRSRLIVKALGASQPVASNATSDGRGLNRRAEIHLAGAAVASAVVPVRVSPEPRAVAEASPSEKAGSPVSQAEPEAMVTPKPETKEPAPADAPLAPPPSASLTPSTTRSEPAAVIAASPRSSRDPVRFWAAVGASAVAVGAAAGAVAFFADSVSGSTALSSTQAQLARTDLLPPSRSAAETHASALSSAITADRVGAGTLGAVAVGAAITAVVLWIQESRSGDAPAPR